MTTTQPELKLPYSGEYHAAEMRRFQEVIVFVPFFGAKKLSLQRHRKFVNELGFDCVLFDLIQSDRKIIGSVFSSSGNFGMKHTWADQIESILAHIPGKKIIYAFSNPGASAIETIARRSATDIKGLICDSGPAGDFWKSALNLYEYERPIKFLPLRAFAATVGSLIWEPKFYEVVKNDLAKFPKSFRVLSIRGWKDKLISPAMIDKVFDPHSQIDWQKLSLPMAGHLNGLKDFADDYKPAVTKFLAEISTRLD